MDKIIIAVGSAVVGLAALVAISFLFSWPLYMLWNNCLVGAVDGVHEVTWLNAWGLSLLFGIMFKTTVTQKG